ncbi:MAG: TrkA C-terminal domain-containing protein, partial [Muribaculaceae bacterium]|nr:TrkA C-terminal domain-containing protein [Muribaculaceae bacterium]
NYYVRPLLEPLAGEWGRLLTVVAETLAMSPFLVALIAPIKISPDKAQSGHNIPRLVLMIFRIAIALGFLVHAVASVYSLTVGFFFALTAVVLLLILLYRSITDHMGRMESKFFDNLNERELRRSGKNNTVVSDLHLAYMTIGTGCPFAGDRLMDSNLRKKYGVNVVSIQRGYTNIPIPNGRMRLYPGDVIGVIGNDEQIAALLPVAESEGKTESGASNSQEITLSSILLSPESPLISKTPSSASLRDNYDVLVVAVNRAGEFIDSNPNLVFAPGDIVWLAGSSKNIAKLK